MTSPLRSLLGLLLLLSVGGCAIARAQRGELRPAIPTPAIPTPATSAPATSAPATSAPATSAPATSAPANPAAEPPQVLAQRLSQNTPIGRPDRQDSPSAQVTSVNVFQLDNQCDDFVGKVVKLPRETALNTAVGEAIKTSSTLDFDLAGYRVVEGPEFGEATVDFRVAPGSERSLQSLSMCESLSLYGSIRRTLTENGQFGFTQVRFTLAGQELP